MAAGLGPRMIGRTTSSVLLDRPVVDPSASDAIPLGCTNTFVVPPGQSSASLRVRASRITEIPHYWHGRKRLVSLPVAIDDGVAVAGSTSSEELINDDREHPKQELNSGEECQEDPSLVPSSTGSRPITLDEVETPTLNEDQRWTIVKTKLAGIMSNAQKQGQGMHQIRHSLGVDLGDSRTGVAISLKGYAPRPLSVLQLKGDKLIENLLQIASKERADEFIVGLPISFDGKETSQSSKTRSFAGRLAAQAAQRGWRVYLLDEYGSSRDGLDYMLDICEASTQIDSICTGLKPSGMKKRSRKEKLDAYAALVLLHSYFSSKGAHVKLLVPKGLALQERLCLGDDSVIEDDF